MRDFGIDGLRLDAIHAIFDSSPSTSSPRSPPGARDQPGALVIAECGLNDPKVMRPREPRRLGLRRRLGRRLPPRAAHADHRRARRLLRRLRHGRPARQGVAPPATSTTATTRRFAGGASARRPTTSRPSASSSSPRTTTRSATAPTATGCRRRRGRWPRSARCCRRSCRCCSWARSTASPRRFSSSPTTSTRRSRVATREGRRREFAAFADVRRARSPIPRIRRRSSARS